MQEGRAYTIRKRPKLILDKLFPVFKELNLEDKGLMSLVGIIRDRNVSILSDETEVNIQSIEIIRAEKVEISDSNRI